MCPLLTPPQTRPWPFNAASSLRDPFLRPPFSLLPWPPLSACHVLFLPIPFHLYRCSTFFAPASSSRAERRSAEGGRDRGRDRLGHQFRHVPFLFVFVRLSDGSAAPSPSASRHATTLAQSCSRVRQRVEDCRAVLACPTVPPAATAPSAAARRGSTFFSAVPSRPASRRVLLCRSRGEKRRSVISRCCAACSHVCACAWLGC